MQLRNLFFSLALVFCAAVSAHADPIDCSNAPQDCYWAPADISPNVYGTKRGTIVSTVDANYTAWVTAGGVAPTINTIANAIAQNNVQNISQYLGYGRSLLQGFPSYTGGVSQALSCVTGPMAPQYTFDFTSPGRTVTLCPVGTFWSIPIGQPIDIFSTSGSIQSFTVLDPTIGPITVVSAGIGVRIVLTSITNVANVLTPVYSVTQVMNPARITQSDTCSASQWLKSWTYTTEGGFGQGCAQIGVSNLSGFGTGVATALGVNVGSAGAPVLFNGALGTPSSGTLTNATGLPIGSGVSGLGTGVATFLGTPSGANLASALTTALPATAGGTGVTTAAAELDRLGSLWVTASATGINMNAAAPADIATLTFTLPSNRTRLQIQDCIFSHAQTAAPSGATIQVWGAAGGTGVAWVGSTALSTFTSTAESTANNSQRMTALLTATQNTASVTVRLTVAHGSTSTADVTCTAKPLP